MYTPHGNRGAVCTWFVADDMIFFLEPEVSCQVSCLPGRVPRDMRRRMPAPVAREGRCLTGVDVHFCRRHPQRRQIYNQQEAVQRDYGYDAALIKVWRTHPCEEWKT